MKSVVKFATFLRGLLECLALLQYVLLLFESELKCLWELLKRILNSNKLNHFGKDQSVAKINRYWSQISATFIKKISNSV